VVVLGKRVIAETLIEVSPTEIASFRVPSGVIAIRKSRKTTFVQHGGSTMKTEKRYATLDR